MKPIGPFAIPAPWLFGAQLGVVTSVKDPENLARVQVRLLAADADGAAEMWARVAVPFAGDNRGAFSIPDVGDEVLVVFVAGDARAPIVIGGLWNGTQSPPEALPGDRVDRWTLTGKAGTHIAIIERGAPKIELETPGGVKGTLTDAGGGKIEFVAGLNRITMDGQGVTVSSATKATVVVNGTSIDVLPGMVSVTAPMAVFSGMISCQVLQTGTVISGSYTPGAGNIW
jgi:phage baseplate assembly protein gpV